MAWDSWNKNTVHNADLQSFPSSLWTSTFRSTAPPPGLTVPLSSVCPEYLDILDVDMMKKPEEINKMQHHTSYYHSDFLIVRRGQEFQVNITFNRPYDSDRDKIAVEFVIGENKVEYLFLKKCMFVATCIKTYQSLQ